MGFGEVLREFGVKISLDFDPKKVEKAQESIEKLGSKLRGFAFELGAITAGLFETQNLFTSNARALEDQSEILGITTQALQQYEYAAKVGANVNREELVGSFQKLADTMDLARAGVPEATQAIYQIGQAAGVGGQQLLDKMRDPTFKVTDAVNIFADGIKRLSQTSPQAAARLTEFALGNAKLIPLLKQGSAGISSLTEEAKKNFVQNDAQIKQGKAMDVQMTKLWLTFRKFGYDLGAKVMVHLAPMIRQFEKWFALNKNIIASNINTVLDVLADVLKVIYEGVTDAFSGFQKLAGVLGGTENAVKTLVAAFLTFKAVELGSSVFGVFSALIGVLPKLSTVAGVVTGIARSFKALMLIEGISDIIPAIQLFGTALFGALAPLLPYIAAIGALAVAIHDIKALMSGEETWTGSAFKKVKGFVGSFFGDNPQAEGGPNPSPNSATPYSSVSQNIASNANPVARPTGTAADVASGASALNQTIENHFNTTNNISVPTGTSAHGASGIISKANLDAYEKLIKAAQDSATSRLY